MDRRIVLGLGIVAVLLMAFIVFHEMNTLSTGELEARRGRVVGHFVRPRVTDVTIEHGDERIVLHRDRAEDLDAMELGHWSMVEPVEDDADQDAVSSLLGAVEYLEARREIGDVSAEDRERFGLTEPRVSLTFQVASETQTVRIGGEDPRGDGVYVESSDREGTVFVVGPDFVEALTHDAAFFRDKSMFRAFSARDVRSVVLDAGDVHARVERRDGVWMITEPFEGLARGAAVEELFGALTETRIARFLREEPGDLGELGLDPPARELTLVRQQRSDEREGTGAGAEETLTLHLRIGGACPDHEDELVAMAGDTGPVVCVAAQEVSALSATVERLQETRLLSIRDDEVDAIAATRDGDTLFEIVRDEQGFVLVVGESRREADGGALADLLRGLRSAEAVSFEPATDENLRARGLSPAARTLVVRRGDDESEVSIHVGNADEEGVFVRRGDEPLIARYDAVVGPMLTVDTLRFRARELVGQDDPDLRSFDITRDGVREELVVEDGTWLVRAPMQVEADRVATLDAVAALAGLQALRFVAESAAPEHGLSRPRAIVHGVFQRGLSRDHEEDEHGHDHDEEEDEPAPADDELRTEVTLQIGADTDDGVFARLAGDPAVFVISSSQARSLMARLASRDLLAVETASVESVLVTYAGGSVEVTRQDGRWSATGSADADRITAFLDRLASLRALEVSSYGSAAPETGLLAPSLTLDVRVRGGDPAGVRLVFGGEVAGAEFPSTYARRPDRALVFAVSTEVVDALRLPL